jgi:hypothetical protein
VAPGLRALGTDFGNGDLDRDLFQFDSRFELTLQEKRRLYRHRPHLHAGSSNLDEATESALVLWFLNELEHHRAKPYGFRRTSDEFRLTDPTGVETSFTRNGLSAQQGDLKLSGLDGIALLIQEDFAFVRVTNHKNWVAFASVCAPSHWDPSETLGKSFQDLHTVVPGFERIAPAAPGLLEAMVHKGPFVRFVWGLETDDRLNHHPTPQDGYDAELWNGRLFDRAEPIVRFERQCLQGFPALEGSLFLIRVGFTPVAAFAHDVEAISSLLAAVRSMSPEARRYKGLDRFFPDLERKLVETGSPHADS